MKKRSLRILAFLLVCVLALSACGKKEGDPSSDKGAQQGGGGDASGAQGLASKDLVWRETPLTPEDSELEEIDFGEGICYSNDTLYLFGSLRSEENSGYRNEVFVFKMKTDGSASERVTLDVLNSSNMWYGMFTTDDEGNIYAVKNVYPKGMYEDVIVMDGEALVVSEGEVVLPEEEQDEMPEAEEEEDAVPTEEPPLEDRDDPASEADDDTEEPEETEVTEETCYVVKFTADGEKVYETKIEPKEPPGEDSWYSVMDLKCVGGNTLVMNDNFGVYLLDPADGSKGAALYEEDQDGYASLVVSGKDELYLSGWGEEGMELTRLDLTGGKQNETILLGERMFLYDVGSARPAVGADFLLSDTTGISAWNVGEETPTPILSFVDSDLVMEYVEQALQVSEEEIILFYYDYEQGEYLLSRLTKVPPEEVKDKKILVLGANGLSSSIRAAVIRFNKENEDYRIVVKDYSREITEGDWNAGVTALNNDIIAGNSPDILLLDTGRFSRSYELKGLLEPLDDYMANDPEIGKTEYLDNIFEIFRYRGTTYVVVPAFSIRTYAVKAKDAQVIEKWSLDELQKIMKERNIDVMKVFGDWPMTRDDILLMSLAFDGKNYFDWDEQRVKFDSQSFIDLMNFAKQFPETIDYSYYENDTSGYYRTGEALVAQAYFGNFRDFRGLKYGSFGEDIEMIGFPREDGTGGSSIMAEMQLAISSRSSEKDACWQFLRYFLTEEYQQAVVDEMGYMFPVARKQLDEMAEKSLEREFYIDEETGEKVFVDESAWINGEEVQMGEMTREDLEQMYRLLESADSAFEYDETLFKMVQEECAPFFNGQKSAEECAKIIQSKAQIYIDENS